MKHKQPSRSTNVISYPTLLLAISVPLLLVLYWHLHNNQYLRSDSGDYFLKAQQIYFQFKESGLWAGIRAFFTDRLWKPVFVSNLMVPAIALTGGNQHAAVALSTGSLTVIYCYYAYRLFLTYLRPWGACAATLVLGTLPIFQASALESAAELPFLAVGMAIVWHLSKDDCFDSWSTSLRFSLWSLLGLLLRPAEVILALFIPATYRIFTAYKQQKINANDLTLLAITTLGVPAAIWLLGRQIPWLFTAGVFIIFIWLFIRAQSQNLNRSFVLWLGILTAGCCLWYLPFWSSLTNWIYSCSFGEFAKTTGGRTAQPYLSFVLDSAGIIAGEPILYLLAIGLAGLFPLSHARSRAAALKNKWLIPVFASALLPLLLIGGITYNATTRYYYGGAELLYIAALLFALLPELPLLKVRTLAVFALAAIQFHVAEASYLRHGSLLPFGLEQIIMRGTWYPVTEARKDPVLSLAKKISTLEQSKSLKFAYLQLMRDNAFDNALDPWALGIASLENGKNWIWDRPWPYGESTREQKIANMHSYYDYLLVGPIGGRVDSVWGFFSDYGEELLKAHAAGQLEKSGLRFVSKIDVTDLAGDTGEFVLLKTKATLK